MDEAEGGEVGCWCRVGSAVAFSAGVGVAAGVVDVARRGRRRGLFVGEDTDDCCLGVSKGLKK
jgi:hypothetical protein